MKITKISPQQKSQERVNIFVDGEFRLGVAEEVIVKRGLKVGQEITEHELEAIQRSDVGWKAREYAVSLLSVRPRTVKELQQRLRKKEFPDDSIEAAIEFLNARGYLNDQAFAEMFVRDRIKFKPRGKRALAVELRMKGVEPETAARAIEETFNAQDSSEVDLAREVAEKWVARKLTGDRMKDRQRLFGFMARRGFSGDSIRQAMDDLL